MSNRWVTAQPYIFQGHNYSTIKGTVDNLDGTYSTPYCLEQILVDEHGQPICVVRQNERTETYDVTSWVFSPALVKHGGVFKHLDAAIKWCENNDWSATMPTSPDSNGVQHTNARPNERQHCPACNTDGEHSFAHTEAKKEFYMCATCGDVHERTPVAKRGSTIDANKQVLSNQSRVAHEHMVDQIAGSNLPKPVIDVGGNGAATFAKTRAEEPFDEIQKAQHYNFSKLEVIDVIEAWGLGFALGNTIKYIARAPHKGTELKDLKKAQWYLKRRVAELERAEEEAAQAVQQ